MNQNKYFPIYIIIVIFISLVVVYYFSNTQKDIQNIDTSFPENFTFLTPAKDLQDFSLIDQDNKSFSKKNLMGKWSLVFFGYTSCPDVCPTTLQVLADTQDKIKALNLKNPVQVVFVSIDPGRDKTESNPEKLKDYISFFYKDFIAVSGDHKNLRELTHQLGAAYEIKNSPGLKNGDQENSKKMKYNVAHTPIIFILNPKAQFNGFIRPPHTPDIIIKTLKIVADNGYNYRM